MLEGMRGLRNIGRLLICLSSYRRRRSMRRRLWWHRGHKGLDSCSTRYFMTQRGLNSGNLRVRESCVLGLGSKIVFCNCSSVAHARNVTILPRQYRRVMRTSEVIWLLDIWQQPSVQSTRTWISAWSYAYRSTWQHIPFCP